MPSPSRFGRAAGYINVSAPASVYEAVDALRRHNDWQTMGAAGLELLVEALRARGATIPENAADSPRTTPKASAGPVQKKRAGA